MALCERDHPVKTMMENRLRKLEAARLASVPVYVWGSSEPEWTARKQERAENAQFVFIRWLGKDDDVKQVGTA